MPIYLYTYIPVYLYTYIPTYLHNYMTVYLYTYTCTKPFIVLFFCVVETGLDKKVSCMKPLTSIIFPPWLHVYEPLLRKEGVGGIREAFTIVVVVVVVSS